MSIESFVSLVVAGERLIATNSSGPRAAHVIGEEKS
jgi:hypothetical protein